MPLRVIKSQVTDQPIFEAKKQTTYVVRDDIPCNSSRCQKCQLFPRYQSFLQQDLLIIPDFNVVSDNLHIVKALGQFNVVYLSSIIQNVSLKNKRLTTQLQQNFSTREMLFLDQVCAETHIQFYSEAKALSAASLYFAKHHKTNILILTSKVLQNIETSENIKVLSIEDLVSEEGFDYFKQMLPVENFDQYQKFFKSDGINSLFVPYVAQGQIDILLNQGKLFQGKFKAIQGGKAGSIHPFQFDAKVKVINAFCVNRALDEDVVVFKLINLEKCKIGEDSKDIRVPLDDLHTDLSKIEQGLMCYAVIFGIVSRERTRIVGTLKQQFSYQITNNQLDLQLFHQEQLFSSVVVPFKKTLPNCLVISSTPLNQYVGQRLELDLLEHGCDDFLRKTSIRRVIGVVGNKNSEVECIMQERGIRCFDLETQEFIKELPKSVVDEDIKNRLQLQYKTVCSIDPPGCKDIDDALHYEEISSYEQITKIWHTELSQQQSSSVKELISQKKLVEVGVHIADVTHFVKYNSIIDKEASNRGTSVYFVDRRIDMLPKLLTELICSLIQGMEHYTFSCLYLIDKESANIIHYMFKKCVVVNKANLCYEDAQKLIDSNGEAQIQMELSSKLKMTLTKSCIGLMNLSHKLKQKRIQNGALELSGEEVSFKLDGKNNPISLSTYQKFETCSLIEEFMLLGNVSAAQFMLQKYPELAILRNHPRPDAVVYEQLQSQMQLVNIDLDFSTNSSLQRSLSDIKDMQLQKTARTLATRAMQLAKYFAAGQKNVTQFYHFGLALPEYTHFTSPIRRYADDLVHRLISAAIGYEPLSQQFENSNKLQVVCNFLNEKKEQADRAGRDCDATFGVLYVLLQLGQLKQKTIGKVISFYKNRATINLELFSVDVQVKLDSWDENGLSGIWNGQELFLYQQLSVNVWFDTQKPWLFQLDLEPIV